MRRILVVCAAALALAGTHAIAAPGAEHGSAVAPACAAGYYKNVDGKCVPRPRKGSHVPPGATAKCRDGTYSFSNYASGTCSHHGGVAVWIHHP